MSALEPQVPALVMRQLLRGRVVPFLGAGVNPSGQSRKSTPRTLVKPWQTRFEPEPRAPVKPWTPGSGSYPSGGQLALHLGDRLPFPVESREDLMEVSSYIEGFEGELPLLEMLREVFAERVPPSPLHRFLAKYRKVAQQNGESPPAPLIVTTNYDSVLERALREENESFDVIAYMAREPGRGKFVHIPPQGEPKLVERPKTYTDIDLDARPVILKVHGTIDEAHPEWSSFVMTEGHYVDYLARDVWKEIPAVLMYRMARSDFLFLGYALHDWNLLVLLRRADLLEGRSGRGSWAIQLNPSAMDQMRWRRYRIDCYDQPLETFVEELEAELSTSLG